MISHEKDHTKLEDSSYFHTDDWVIFSELQERLQLGSLIVINNSGCVAQGAVSMDLQARSGKGQSP